MTRMPPAINEVHLVWGRLDLSLWEALPVDEWLSPDERERAARLKVPAAAKQFRIGRALLRGLLAKYLALSPDSLRFHYNDHGKPALEGQNGHDGLHFNLSHSGGLLVVALVPRREIGVDVEQIRSVMETEHIVAWLFPEWARQRFGAAGAHQRDEEFFRCWTRLEATAKAYGTGIAGTKLVPPTPLTVYELSAIPGYVASLAVQGSDDNLHIVEQNISHLLPVGGQ